MGNFRRTIILSAIVSIFISYSSAHALPAGQAPAGSSGSPSLTAPVLVNASNGLPCSNYKTQYIYPVRNYNGQNVCPTSASRLIYVSATGNDANNGSSMNTPVKTFMRAAALMGQQRCNCWIMFKRGDIFTDPKPVIRADRSQGGISEQLPLVFTAYGPGNARPQFFRAADGLNIWGHVSRPDFGNIILSGLHFKTRPGLGSPGIRILYGGKNMVIEDNYIEGMGVGLII